MTDPRDEPCFFILGYGRSGTTLLRRMLSVHPRLYVNPENDVFQWLPTLAPKGVVDVTALDAILERFPPYFGRIYDLDDFDRQARSGAPLTVPDAIALLQKTSLISGGKDDAIWGHKMPSEWPYVPQWREWFPNARFIHLVRHPHDATASMVDNQLQRYRTTPLIGGWQWRKAFRAIRRQGLEMGPDRYWMLHYEDLVDDTPTALARVCEFLGVSDRHVPAMIDFRTDASAAFIDGGAHMAMTNSAVTASRVGRSSGTYSAAQEAMLNHIFRGELEQLGYEARGSASVSPARASAIDASCAGLDLAWAGLRISRRARRQL